VVASQRAGLLGSREETEHLAGGKKKQGEELTLPLLLGLGVGSSGISGGALSCAGDRGVGEGIDKAGITGMLLSC